MALILRNGGSQSPDRWLRDPRNNQLTLYNLNYGTNYATQVNENVIEISEEKIKKLMPEYSKKKLAKA